VIPVYVVIAASAAAGVAVGFGLGYLAGARRQAPVVQPGNGIELYVGNLPYNMKDRDLARLFEKHGQVLSARIIKNKFNNRSRGYGFVEMVDQSTADHAIKAANGQEVKGRKIVVNEAKSKSRD